MQNDAQEPARQQNQGCRNRYQGFLIAVSLFLSVIFLIWFVSTVSSGMSTRDDRISFYASLLGLIISLMTLIVTFAAWLLPGNILSEKLKAMLSGSSDPTSEQAVPQKPRYFVSYHESDFDLAMKDVIVP